MTEREALSAKLPYLKLRCRALEAIRSFFLGDGFLEVQTPLRTPAPAPETHIDALTADPGYFLVTSPELYMKRLLAAGYGPIYQMSPVFRQGERGRLHHPEFTLLEWYRPDADYSVLQEDCQRLVLSVCKALGRTAGWDYRGTRLDVNGAWERYTVREAFTRFAGWTPEGSVDQDRFDIDLVEKVEPRLGFPKPCFLTDYPAGQAALARLKPGDPAVAERFELYWAGIELANGYSELTDPKEQRTRFQDAMEARRQAGRDVYPIPESFLNSMEHLPPCAGIAMGVDRLVMLLTGVDSIDSVVAFPPELAGG
jgi:lysyl-tRNA synthetase class 2